MVNMDFVRDFPLKKYQIKERTRPSKGKEGFDYNILVILWQCKENILWLRILPDTSKLSQQSVNMKNLLILTKR